MLRTLRIIIATLVIISMSLLFLDFTGVVHCYLGWLAKVQFIPALLGSNALAIFGLLLLTVLFGRIYCSMLCPLGILQDASLRLTRNRKKKPFSYCPTSKLLMIIKYMFLACFTVSLIIGISFITGLLEPYSVFGRIVSQFFSPLYLGINNILAFYAERMDSYTFYTVEIWTKSLAITIITALNILFIAFLVRKKGRIYCNSICPVGTILGIFSKKSLWGITISPEKCTKCKLCERNCKASCIDIEKTSVDQDNCIRCFDCLSICPTKAVSFTRGSVILSKAKNLEAFHDIQGDKESVHSESTKSENSDPSRRNFVSKIGLLVIGLFTAFKVNAYDFDGGLTPLADKIAPRRTVKIVPPGARSHRNFDQRCTACQMCVSVCPYQVLRPSNKLRNFMQPTVSYERGYCRPECIKCSTVCPSNAIQKITREEKSSIQIGYAVYQSDLCVMVTDAVNCDRCSTKCPTGAITLVEQPTSDGRMLKLPVVEKERCIGCGACEQLCPARPYSAIYVEGVDTHRMI